MATRGDVLDEYCFGKFRLEPGRRSLTAAGKPVTLSARAFDILCLLVERRETVVSKDELRTAVWRGMTVDDNNLAVQISTLRRALGEGFGGPHYILTVPGRGYQFVAPLDCDTPPALPAPLPDIEKPAPTPAAPQAARPRTLRRPLALAAALLTLGLAAWLALPYVIRPAAAPRLSLVVLPFRNLSGEAEQDYLADAISDDLTTDLSHIPGSTVIARTSADTYRGRPVQAEVIGRALHVRYLLEGSIRAEGGSLHINAQLIDAPTGAHLWARAFDVDRDKLGVARTAIVRNIASALDVTLVEIESARSLHDRPDNADAEDFFLRARSVIGRGNTLASLTEAQALLEQSVAKAPHFADALAALGYVLARKTQEFDDPDEVPDGVRAQEVIAQAVALAPQNPAAITAKAYLERMNGKLEAARASFRMALQLDPNDIAAHYGLAACASDLGRMDEVIAEFQALLRIDPASPANAKRQYAIGYGNLMLGKPREALDWFQRAGAGLVESGAGETTIGWQEWRQIFTMSAKALVGDIDGAARDYAAYNAGHKQRTVWRLASYDMRGVTALPGHAAYLEGLKQAGMPAFGAEDEDFGLPPTATPREGSDFDPTPLEVPGAKRIRTLDLKALLAGPRPPLVLDVGRGAAVIPGAVWLWQNGLGDLATALRRATAKADPATTIVVMGDAPTGWMSYNAGLRLVADGFHSVLWYRGGDEAWAAAGNKAEDRRTP
jgi:TolB-like protein/DNA-binding winged helix-turn-helix (wHTH) protein